MLTYEPFPTNAELNFRQDIKNKHPINESNQLSPLSDVFILGYITERPVLDANC